MADLFGLFEEAKDEVYENMKSAPDSAHSLIGNAVKIKRTQNTYSSEAFYLHYRQRVSPKEPEIANFL